MVLGEAVLLAIDLYPTAYRFAAGHRIRLTIAGADLANTRVPAADPPVKLTLKRGGEHDSLLELPVIPASH
jgi:predicted acyl esterase